MSSTPKYNRLYEAFGWEIPAYIHCPLITDEDGKKLSKRSGHSSFEDLIEQGFLTESIVNFVALLGWSPGAEREIFSLQELIEIFDYKNMSKSPAVFDMKKFRWMNGEYIKNMAFEDFHPKALPYLQEAVTKEGLDLEKISRLVQTRIEVLTEIKEQVDFFNELPDYSIDLYNHKKMQTNPENSLESLEKVLPLLKSQENWSKEVLHDVIMNFVQELGIKNGKMLWPLRTALSGKPSTPGGAFDLAEILGKEESIRRIEVGIQKLNQ